MRYAGPAAVPDVGPLQLDGQAMRDRQCRLIEGSHEISGGGVRCRRNRHAPAHARVPFVGHVAEGMHAGDTKGDRDK